MNVSFRNADERLAEIFRSFEGKTAVIADENTARDCLPLVIDSLPKDKVTIQIFSGEENKNLETCELIWTKLTDGKFHRKDLVINLGGGVIGDMGGFCAATFKRGIKFVNIPTTLLSQVDASIGGKLGIDFLGFKNHIGLFQNPDEVIIDTRFLKTLPPRELQSGFAEVLKHSLIADASQWSQNADVDINKCDFTNLIQTSIRIKSDIVASDFNESGQRKLLNFGHSIGHGIESYFLNSKNPLLHGEAIAAGMIMESWLSCKLKGLPKSDLVEIAEMLKKRYGKVEIQSNSKLEILELIKMDKKNIDNRMLFTLLTSIGSAEYDIEVSGQLVVEAFDYYKTC